MKIDDNKLANDLSDLHHSNECFCSAEVSLELSCVLGLERLLILEGYPSYGLSLWSNASRCKRNFGKVSTFSQIFGFFLENGRGPATPLSGPKTISTL